MTFIILNISQAQSDPKLSNFIFSPLTYNPAYAGSYQGMSISSLYSTQWVGFDGAPQTMFLSGHTKYDDRVGLGIDFMNDKEYFDTRNHILSLIEISNNKN